MQSMHMRNIMETTNEKDISIVYLNIGSLPAHIDELETYLEITNCYPSFIALAETKITETVNSLFLPNIREKSKKDDHIPKQRF